MKALREKNFYIFLGYKIHFQANKKTYLQDLKKKKTIRQTLRSGKAHYKKLFLYRKSE